MQKGWHSFEIVKLLTGDLVLSDKLAFFSPEYFSITMHVCYCLHITSLSDSGNPDGNFGKIRPVEKKQ